MTFDEYMKEQMKDPEFAKAYEEIQPEMNVIRAIVNSNLSQKELSEKSGIPQKELNDIEEGTKSPTLENLMQLAEGLEMKLNLTFEPK